MSTEQAQSAVTLSAFLVAAVFAYRKLIEKTASSSTVPATGHFVIGFGFTYVLLSLFAQGAPTFGGMMAILVATGDLLVNGQPLAADITAALKATQSATAGGSSASLPSNSSLTLRGSTQTGGTPTGTPFGGFR